MVSILLVGVIISIHGYVHPFKDKTNNNLELFLNLQILLVVSIYNTPYVVNSNGFCTAGVHYTKTCTTTSAE